MATKFKLKVKKKKVNLSELAFGAIFYHKLELKVKTKEGEDRCSGVIIDTGIAFDYPSDLKVRVAIIS